MKEEITKSDKSAPQISRDFINVKVVDNFTKEFEMFRASKQIIAENMGYFRDMFRDSSAEKRKVATIEINCDPKVFRIILNFCTERS